MPPIVVYVAVGMLWIGAAPLPYGYYTLLRLVATIVFVWAAYVAHQREYKVLPYAFGLLALLFNPIIVIQLDKPLWVVIDIAAGIFLLATSPHIKKTDFVNRLVATTTIQDQAIIDEVIKLPVSSRQSHLANYHVIRAEYEKESEWLISELKASDIEIKLEEFERFLRKTQNNSEKYFFLSNIVSLTDDEKECVSNVIQGMLRSADKNVHSISGLFQSCADFDEWVREGMLHTIEDSRIEIIFETASNTVYQETIFFISSKTKGSSIKASLRKYLLLHHAMAIVVPKVAAEGDNSISRFFQKLFGTYP